MVGIVVMFLALQPLSEDQVAKVREKLTREDKVPANGTVIVFPTKKPKVVIVESSDKK